VKVCWLSFESNGKLTPQEEERLSAIELRDGVFPDIDPSFWEAGAKAADRTER